MQQSFLLVGHCMFNSQQWPVDQAPYFFSSIKNSNFAIKPRETWGVHHRLDFYKSDRQISGFTLERIKSWVWETANNSHCWISISGSGQTHFTCQAVQMLHCNTSYVRRVYKLQWVDSLTSASGKILLWYDMRPAESMRIIKEYCEPTQTLCTIWFRLWEWGDSGTVSYMSRSDSSQSIDKFRG